MLCEVGCEVGVFRPPQEVQSSLEKKQKRGRGGRGMDGAAELPKSKRKKRDTDKL